MTMSTGEDDDDNVSDGDGAMGEEVDNDCNDNDYGDGQRGQ